MSEQTKAIGHFFKQGQKVKIKPNLPNKVKSEDGTYTHSLTTEHRKREGKIVTIEECKTSGSVLYYYADSEIWMKDCLQPIDIDCEVTFEKGGKKLTKVLPTYELAETFIKELEKKGLAGIIRVKE